MAKTINIRPFAIGAHNSANWSLAAGGTRVLAIDPGVPPTSDGTTTYLQISDPNTGKQSFDLVAGDIPGDIGSVISVQVGAYIQNRDNVSTTQSVGFFTRDGGGTDGAITTRAGWGFPFVLLKTSVGRPGGGPWLAGDIVQSLEFCIDVSSWSGVNSPTHLVQLTSLWMILNYEPAPTDIGASHDAASRRLWFLSRPAPDVLLSVPPHVGLDVELLDDVALSHPAMPHATADGYLSKKWERG